MEESQGNKRKRVSEAFKDGETAIQNPQIEDSLIPEIKKQNATRCSDEPSSAANNDNAITFNNDNWDWIEKFTEAEKHTITLVGPYLHKSRGEQGSPGYGDLVGEVEARAVFDMVKTLSSKGYDCPSMVVPKNFDLTLVKDFFSDEDFERLRQLPLGVSYAMLKEPEKEIVIMDSKGSKCGHIVHYGAPPNFTWLKIRCCAKSRLADSILPLLQGGADKFAFAKFEHNKLDITNEEYMTTSNSSGHEGDENLKIYVETGDIDIAIVSKFTVRRGDDIVAKALMSYNNTRMLSGGPNMVQIEVAKEWQQRGIMSWLVSSMEDYYVQKFAPVLGEYTSILNMTVGNGKDDCKRDEADWFSYHGYRGDDVGRSKSLEDKVIARASKLAMQKEIISRGLKASLNSAIVRVVPGDTLTPTSIKDASTNVDPQASSSSKTLHQRPLDPLAPNTTEDKEDERI